MTAWERVPAVEVKCGNCGRWLASGAPVFVITIERGTLRPLRMFRCEEAKCAGPAPPDLPLRIVTAPIVRTTLGKTNVWDVIDRAVERRRSREPGEEG